MLRYLFCIFVLVGSWCQAQITILQPSQNYYYEHSHQKEVTVIGTIESDTKVEKVELEVYAGDQLQKKYDANIYLQANTSNTMFHGKVTAKSKSSCIKIKASLANSKIIDKEFVICTSPYNSQVSSSGYPLQASVKVHSDLVRSIAFSRNNRFLVSGSDDTYIKISDPRSLKTIRTLKGHIGYVRAVAITPDDKLIVSIGNDKSIRKWDLATGKLLGTTYFEYTPLLLVLSYNGKYAATAGRNSKVILWDIKTLKKVTTFSEVPRDYHAMVFSRDNRFIITSDDKNKIIVWDVEKGKKKFTRTKAHVRRRLKSGTVKYTYEDPVKIQALALHPNMRYMYSGDKYGIVRWWLVLLNADDAKWNKESRKIWEIRLAYIEKRSRDYADIKPDKFGQIGAQDFMRAPIFIITKKDPKIKSKKELNQFSSPISDLSFSGDGKLLLVVSLFGKFRILETHTGRKRFSKTLPSKPICGAFSYDASMAAAGDMEGKIYVYGLP